MEMGVASEGLMNFLRSWYGAANAGLVIPPRATSNEGSPWGLLYWQACERSWGRLTFHHRMLAPEQRERDGTLTTFCVESQAVWLFAYGEGSNPEVFDRHNVRTRRVGGDG